MGALKLISVIYISYLLIDGILHFIKFTYIFAEFGFIIMLKGVKRFIMALFQKLTKKSGVELKVIDYYMPGGIAFIDKPMNPDILYRPIHNLRLFIRIILKPTLLIDYCGGRITVFCAIEKGIGHLSSQELNRAIIVSILKLGYGWL